MKDYIDCYPIHADTQSIIACFLQASQAFFYTTEGSLMLNQMWFLQRRALPLVACSILMHLIHNCISLHIRSKISLYEALLPLQINYRAACNMDDRIAVHLCCLVRRGRGCLRLAGTVSHSCWLRGRWTSRCARFMHHLLLRWSSAPASQSLAWVSAEHNLGWSHSWMMLQPFWNAIVRPDMTIYRRVMQKGIT